MERIELFSDGSKRLDVFLSEETGLTRSAVKSLIEDGRVTCDGTTVTKAGDKKKGTIIVTRPDPVAISAEGEDLPIDIVYEDSTPSGTLVNALVYRVKDLSEINGVTRPGIVHRLDKDTSGLLVIAKNNVAHLSLAKQIETKTAGRYYIALLHGNIIDDEGVIDKAIARSVKDRKKMAPDDNGRRAVTHFKVLERFGDFTLCEFKLETGRTHQIRVHAKYINHPVVGDVLYGHKDSFGLNGQLLHAYKLVLTHPDSGNEMTFEAPLPDYFQKVLEKLRKNRS